MIEWCMEGGLYESFGWLPFSAIFDWRTPHDLAAVSTVELKNENESVSDIVMTQRKKCIERHKSPDCESTVYVTSCLPQIADELSFTLVASTSPEIEIESHPQIEFFEYLTLLISTFSMWTGMAIISFNPVTFLLGMKRALTLPQSLSGKAGTRKTGRDDILKEVKKLQARLIQLSVTIGGHHQRLTSSMERLQLRVTNVEGRLFNQPYAPRNGRGGVFWPLERGNCNPANRKNRSIVNILQKEMCCSPCISIDWPLLLIDPRSLFSFPSNVASMQ